MTLIESVHSTAKRSAEAVCLLAPLRPPLTYGRLSGLLEDNARGFAGLGLRDGSRIGVMMENGPELGTALLSVMGFGVAVPLNPALSGPELSYCLESLRIAALLCDAQAYRKVREICRESCVPCLTALVDERQPAGIFTAILPPDAPVRIFPEPKPGCPPGGDIAAVFLTSGTTGRPRFVPLTHEKIRQSAANYAAFFSLSPEDRALAMIPFHHIHGFVTVLAATLLSGGSAVCLPRFGPDAFFRILREQSPTWYTAGPTIHQAVASHAAARGGPGGPCRLKRISSGAAPLKEEVRIQLETLFNVPVLEGYGMTETASAVILNPPPPGRRMPGSVGRPNGCEVRIVDERGAPVPSGTVGEIALRGPTVFDGYEEDGVLVPALKDGWFHSGDLGRIDREGYIYIVGRCKEMINRGGQKIAPREVEDHLDRLPQVRESACFALPHPRLGEDVAAAVVLEPEAVLSPAEIRTFLQERVADYKIPRRIWFVEALPRGGSGKLLRHELQRLAERSGTQPYEPPLSDMEKWLAGIWGELLGLDRIGVHEDFFGLGGDSLLAEQLTAEIFARCRQTFPGSLLRDYGTIAALAERIERGGVAGETVTALRSGGLRAPLFCFHAIYGDVMPYYKLVDFLPPDLPVFGVRYSGEAARRAADSGLKGLAVYYAGELRRLQPQGPYRLAGYSFGGILAFETARVLEQAGQKTEFLALLDTEMSLYWRGRCRRTADFLRFLAWRLRKKWTDLRQMSCREAAVYLRRKFGLTTDPARQERIRRSRLIGVRRELERLAGQFRPGPYAGSVCLFAAQGEEERASLAKDESMGWSGWIGGGIRIVPVPGNHVTMMEAPFLAMLADSLGRELERPDRGRRQERRIQTGGR